VWSQSGWDDADGGCYSCAEWSEVEWSGLVEYCSGVEWVADTAAPGQMACIRVSSDFIPKNNTNNIHTLLKIDSTKYKIHHPW
jgi:hypothetical protein